MTQIEAILAMDTPAQRQALIEELEQEEPNPFITVRLSDVGVRRLADHINQLPVPYYRLLLLSYGFYYPEKKLRKRTGFTQVNGTIRYVQDRLTQAMGLTRPISQHYWKKACDLAILDMTN